MARVDAFASRSHYLEHLAPLWRAIDPAHRGRLFVAYRLDALAAELELEHTVIAGRRGYRERPPSSSAPTLVAGWQDGQDTRSVGRPLILLEHGAGQTYADLRHPAYIGGRDRGKVLAVLVPSERAAAHHRAAWPTIPAHVIGSPRVDELELVRGRHRRGPRPAVAFSFHWDLRLRPETRWAFPEFSRSILRLRAHRPDLELLGHGHPRAWPALERFYAGAGIEPVRRFVDVVERADVYAVDNSSTLFEAAAVELPVVVLNSRHYRRDVEHGLRFWEAADVGPQVDAPDELEAAIEVALDDAPDIAARRRAIVEDVYAHRRRAAPVAAEVIAHVLEESAPCH